VKRVVWEDLNGRPRVSLLRDNDSEDHPEIGLPIEPPPIESIIRDAAPEIQNELVRCGIITYADLERQQTGLTGIVMGVLRRRIIEAYKLKEKESHG
jgi:hypothetical protein